MVPKSADGYSRLSKELQIAALIAGAIAGLIVLFGKAERLHAHVDLIDPGLHEYERELEQERRANDAIYGQEYSCKEESETAREAREWSEEWDREFEYEWQHRYDGPFGSQDVSPSGASYDHDRD